MGMEVKEGVGGEIPDHIVALLDQFSQKYDAQAGVLVMNALMVWSGAIDGGIPHIDNDAGVFVELIEPYFDAGDLEVFLEWLGIIRMDGEYKFVGVQGFCDAPLRMRAFRERLFEGYKN